MYKKNLQYSGEFGDYIRWAFLFTEKEPTHIAIVGSSDHGESEYSPVIFIFFESDLWEFRPNRRKLERSVMIPSIGPDFPATQYRSLTCWKEHLWIAPEGQGDCIDGTTAAMYMIALQVMRDLLALHSDLLEIS